MMISAGSERSRRIATRDIWGGWAVILLFFLGFGIFSFMVPLDSAATAEGQ
jgi:hypothetical protein